MRKFKKVKRKEIIFDLTEWTEVEHRAASVSMKTGNFIRRMTLNGKVVYYDMKEAAPVLNALRIIGKNINQIARKANELNSIYAEDIKALQKEYAEICHTLTRFMYDLTEDKKSKHKNIA